MRAEFTQDGMNQGYARVTLTREAGDAAFYEEGDSIALGHFPGNSCEYLCASGNRNWSGAPEALALEVKPEVQGESVSFELQPAYVDSMDDGVYRVCLMGADGRVKAETDDMPAYDVSWSGLEGTSTIKDYRLEEARLREEEEAARRKEREEAERRRAEEEAAKAAGAAEAGSSEELPSLDAGGSAPAAPQGKSRAPLIAAAVVVALLAAGGAYFMTQGGSEPSAEQAEQDKAAQEKAEAEKKAAEEAAKAEAEKKAAAEKQAAEEAAKAEAEKAAAEKAAAEKAAAEKAAAEKAAAEKAAAEKAAAEKAAAEKAAADKAAAEKAAAEKKAAEEAAMRADARGRVASFFVGERNPEAAMKLASELDADTPEQQDAIFRLYYYAAGEDNAQAAQRYAECVDPSRPAWGSISKDGAEAWYYYGKSPDGEKARASLKAWTEKAAAEGNAEAAAWLKDMK